LAAPEGDAPLDHLDADLVDLDAHLLHLAHDRHAEAGELFGQSALEPFPDDADHSIAPGHLLRLDYLEQAKRCFAPQTFPKRVGHTMVIHSILSKTPSMGLTSRRRRSHRPDTLSTGRVLLVQTP